MRTLGLWDERDGERLRGLGVGRRNDLAFRSIEARAGRRAERPSIVAHDDTDERFIAAMVVDGDWLAILDDAF